MEAQAIGTDGLTPLFGVDTDGYWTVSYDNGNTYTTIKDTEGCPVSALPADGADEYFKNVTLKDGIFTIELMNGEKVSMRVKTDKEELDIIFMINATDEIQKFAPGEHKVYAVARKGVVSASVISKPKGWNVILEEERLIVIAPEELSLTKVSADSEHDIAILALSAAGKGIISKISVALESTPIDPEMPEDE